ncbi:hypothetical protein PUN28_010576 [Cardiocondyla obscurior]|uniref:Uncharacterized protein n=1 Tax=Cardiocondyla obscurior TaxID=286306 RepID=A0AAW2FHY3_9HYME
MISFETHRNDSRICLASFCSSSLRAAVSYRTFIIAELQNPFPLLRLPNVLYRGGVTKHALPSLFTELVINVSRDTLIKFAGYFLVAKYLITAIIYFTVITVSSLGE